MVTRGYLYGGDLVLYPKGNGEGRRMLNEGANQGEWKQRKSSSSYIKGGDNMTNV